MMCGFVGFTQSRMRTDNKTIIQAMMEAIVHRGPDSGGSYADERIALGFRRLKIIDLTDEGNQPMFNEDGNLVLVFNGEIYNYREMRTELEARGHRFRSRSDSEAIVHGYEEYGTDVLHRLRGMFAFAIWDRDRGRLFMARDHFGIKPLYYTRHTRDGSLLFGSEIKAFMKHPAFIKEVNPDALKPYLTFQYSVLDETFFKGVYKLRPGHYLTCEEGEIKVDSYWDADYEEERDSLASYADRITRTLRESVDYHRQSDVKVGSFLSGGIDSSYITALLKPDQTFSVGFRDYKGIFNETNLAQDLSKQLNIENHTRLVSADDFFDVLPTIQYHMDEPQSNLSSVPLYFLSELASRHVTVVLSGEGADELFGGYAWYESSPKMRTYRRVPFAVRRAVSSLTGKLPANRLSEFLIKGGQKVEETFIGQAKVFTESDADAVLKAEYRAGPSARSITEPFYMRVNRKDDLTKMQYLDLKLWLAGDILLKADKMSAAHSLELRVPFLDKEVMALAARLPSKLRVHPKQSKYALRVAAKGVLPESWANRPKVGFPVPIRDWLREEKYYLLVKRMFSSERAEKFFDKERLLSYLEEHYAGKRNRARYIWTVYVFLIWHQVFFEEAEGQSPSQKDRERHAPV